MDSAVSVDRLPSDQREALVMVVVHGITYEQLAEHQNCAVGTAKSRVVRARRQLEAWLLGDETATQTSGELVAHTRVPSQGRATIT